MWTWNATPFRVVEVEGTGRLRGEKLEGRWVERFTGGAVWEGRYVEGKRHGHWVEHYSGGAVHEGPYADGKRHGRWTARGPEPDAPSTIQVWVHGSLVGGNPQ